MTTQKENTEQQNINLENLEASALLDRGVEFTVRKRKFLLKRPYLGTLDMMSKISLEMAFNIDDVKVADDQWMHNINRITHNSAKKYALLLAIAVLNNKWKIRLFSGFLANWFYWNIKPHELEKLASLILEGNSMVDFIRSISLISGMTRTTKPNLIEKNQSKQA